MPGMKRKRTSFESFENSRGKFCGKNIFGGKKPPIKTTKKTTNNKITFKITFFTFFTTSGRALIEAQPAALLRRQQVSVASTSSEEDYCME